MTEHPSVTRFIPLWRSQLHTNIWPVTTPADHAERRLCLFVTEAEKDVLVPEVFEWVKPYSNQMWSRMLLDRLLTVRNEWSRK